MDTSKPTYIDKVEIKGLWGRFDVDWDLNADVNILVGENGTGKSTILEIMYKFLEANTTNYENPPNYKNHYEELITYMNCSSVNLMLSNTLILDPHLRSAQEYTQEGRVKSNYSYSLRLNNLNYIKTFDTNLINTYNLSESEKDRIKTDLDKHLDDSINKYVDYQLSVSKRVISKEKTIEEASEKLIYFQKTINHLFLNTNKKIDETENRLAFLIDGNQIKPKQLSSGEKQLLFILLTVLVQDEKPSILIMDEPEISLHIRWQHELIEIIRTLNPNCQLIIATHSPSMFNDGHREKVFWMEDIVSTSKTGEV